MTEPPANSGPKPPSPRRGQRVLYILTGGAVALASCALILFLFADNILNGYLRPKLINLVQKAGGGACSFQIGQIELLPTGALELTDIRFAADTTAGWEQKVVPLLASLAHIDVDTVRLSGISWHRLLMKGGFYASRMEISSPRIRLRPRTEGRDTAQVQAPDQSADYLPVISIERVTLHNGQILLPSTALGDSSEGISLELHGFHLDRSSARSGDALPFSRDGGFVVTHIARPSPDSLHIFSVRSIRGSFADSVLTIDSLAIHPTLDEEAFARQKIVRLRFDLFFRRLALAGADLPRLVDGRAVLLRSVLAEDWTTDIYLDKRMSLDPTPHRRVLPHEAFQRLKIPVRIDSVLLRKGNISYRERWPTDSEPGVTTFERLSGSILRISNDRSLVRPPTMFEGTLYAMGEGRLDFTFEYPLLSPTFTMRGRGALREMKMEAVNRTLVHTKRLRIRERVIDSIIADVNIRNGSANGTLLLAYHDFDLEVLTKTAWGEKGLREKIGTFVANTFKLKSHNPEKGLPLRPVQIQNRWMGDVSFFNFLWITVRGGIGSVMGFKGDGSPVKPEK